MSHITIITREEIQLIKNKLHKVFADYIQTMDISKVKVSNEELLLNLISELVIDDWTDLGLGTIKQGKNEVNRLQFKDSL